MPVFDRQLNLVAEAYDKAIDSGRKGLATEYPEYILNDPDYPLYVKAVSEGLDSDSGSQEIKEYLSPSADMKFIDLGCCLNLMFRGYDEWPSMYYGVDISHETIKLLKDYAYKRNLRFGSLHCCSIHETPFTDNSFDIGACIGVLEYFDREFVEKALVETHRIIKPDGRFVLDIPDNENPMRRFMKILEEHRGCPNQFDMSPQEFNDMIENYFEVDKVNKIEAVAMIQYYVRCKK